ncbi:monooxygenase [Dictyobacter alpinus]|uniref:Monooxygenase n=1 Tax=Dictyobacter alpinus TaxID=2014873 RepID=A0A402BIT6_9CHLR|nr:FAD-dependent monooxygenase [Dictyobacter alpinus]GCE31246.1 monooxygenase [Dictyobacter alpinus]
MLRVLIVGGGLGGLCLAHGLQQAGVSVAVYERDATPISRHQGYRIHIDTRGASGLRACLPSNLYELFTATASRPGRHVTVLNKQLKVMRKIGSLEMGNSKPDSFSAAVDRLTLREVLLNGLEDALHFHKDFHHYEQQTDGSVHAYFADGTEASGDVLVAADGVNSRIRQQFLATATSSDTGMSCIYGKTLLNEATRPLIPGALHDGFTVVAGLQPFNMALGLVDFQRTPAEASAELAPAIQFHTSGAYLMWSLNAARAQFAASDQELFQMDGAQLQQIVAKKIKSWHPDLRLLVAASDSAEIFPIAVRVAVPCEPWQSTSITFLGDAIHAMSPAGGSGANMALQDARLLCQALISVARGEQALVPAIHAYEARMLTDGFAAVNFSARGGVFNADAKQKRSWFQNIFNFASRA